MQFMHAASDGVQKKMVCIRMCICIEWRAEKNGVRSNFKQRDSFKRKVKVFPIS